MAARARLRRPCHRRLPARNFSSLQELNAQALVFCHRESAQRRCPEDHSLSVRAARELERPLLLPLPETTYPGEKEAHIDALRKEKRRAKEPAILRRLTVAVPAAEDFFHLLAARGGALGPSLVRMERLLDLYSPAELQAALLAAADLPSPQIHDIHVLLDQRKRQRCLPPPVGVHLPQDSPLRALSVTPHSLASYDALTPQTEDSDDAC